MYAHADEVLFISWPRAQTKGDSAVRLVLGVLKGGRPSGAVYVIT